MLHRTTSLSTEFDMCDQLAMTLAGLVETVSDGSCIKSTIDADSTSTSRASNDVHERLTGVRPLISRIRGVFSFGKPKRRRSAPPVDAVGCEVQMAERRLLLSAQFSVSSADSGSIGVPERISPGELENQAPLLRYIEINQGPFGADGYGQVEGYDKDGDVLEYSIVGGRTAELFELDTASGALSFRHKPESLDTATHVDTHYEVVIRVSDGQLQYDQEVSFRPLQENSPYSSSQLIITPENVKTVGVQTNSVTADRRIFLTGPDADLFASSSGGGIRFIDRPDFENPQGVDADNDYHVTRVIDLLGRGQINQQVTVRVTDIEDDSQEYPDAEFVSDGSLRIAGQFSPEDFQTFRFELDSDSVIRLPFFESIPLLSPEIHPLSLLDASGRELLPVAGANTYEIKAGIAFIRVNEAAYSSGPFDLSDRFEFTISVTPISQLVTDAAENAILAEIPAIGTEAEERRLFRFEVAELSLFNVRPGENQTLLRLDSVAGRTPIFVQNGAQESTLRLAPGTWYLTVDQITERTQHFPTASLIPLYTDAISYSDALSATLSTRPVFGWDAAENVREYEIYVGRRGEQTAVFRTRGFTENEFQLPNDIEPGAYTVWARVYHTNGTISRWGQGHDVVIGGRPQVDVNGSQVVWNAVPGADRYEVWADHVDEFGNLITEKVVSDPSIVATSFTVTGEYADRNLTWWVRALSDIDGSVERSAWSRAAFTQQPVFLRTPENAIVTQRNVCFELPLNSPCPAVHFFPKLRWDTVDGASEYEVFIRPIGETEPVLRERRSADGLELRGGQLPVKHEIWIRALGTGAARSRWTRVTEFLIHNDPQL